MRDEEKTKEELISELGYLGKQLAYHRRKSLDEMMEGHESCLASLSDSVPIGLVVIEAGTHRVVEANDMAASMIGTPAEQIIGSVCHEFICPAKVGHCPVTDMAIDLDNSEGTLVRKDGRKIPIMRTAVAITVRGEQFVLETLTDITRLWGAQERVQELLAALQQRVAEQTLELRNANRSLQREIVEHKKTETALRASELRYRNVYETAPLAFVLWNDLFQITDWNEQAERTFGWNRAEVMGRNFFEFLMPPDIHTAMNQAVSELLHGKPHTMGISKVLTKSGEVLICEWNNAVQTDGEGNVTGVMSLALDITQRRHAEGALKISESALRESQGLLHEVVDGIPIATFVLGKDHKIIYWNRALEELTGMKAGQQVGTSRQWKAFYKKERPTMADLLVDEAFDKIAVWYPGKYRQSPLLKEAYEFIDFYPALGENGKWLRLTAAVVRSVEGRLIGAVETLEDVTEHKQAEEELRELQIRLSETFRFLPDATMVINKDGRVIAWNRAIEAMTGIKAQDMLGKGDYEYSIPFYGERRPILIDLAMHPAPHMDARYTSIHRVGDTLIGESFTPNLLSGNVHLSATASVLRDSRGEVIAAIECIRDNTERKKIEERLQRAEKMEALGTMAGGVAHDLNNVLGVLVGYSELLLMEIPENHPKRKPISMILKSSQRAAAIIEDLLALTRRGVAVSTVVNLNSIVDEHFRSPEFENLISNHVHVNYRVDLARDLLNIKGSPVHLTKTITNLVSNASEAIAGPGVVSLRTQNCYIDRPVSGYDAVREGDYVVLTISDNGMGISPQDIKKIFEPFYTKKVMGRSGTGLGLAVVWGTVKDHNGYIDVQSTEGEGTTFSLYFPVTREAAHDEEEPSPVSEYMGKGEAILVVDDIDAQRMLATQMLERLNYSVTAVSGGEDALEHLRYNKVDLVVLDMIMDPGIDGLETYSLMLQVNPDQKAIIVSGYSETDRVKEAQRLGAGAYIRKPYILETLGMAVRREIDKVNL